MSARDIFGAKAGGNFVAYHVELQVHDKLIGGIPKDPDTIRKWIESRIGQGADLALQQTLDETVAAMTEATGEAPEFGAVLDQVTKAVEAGNGFKSIDGQLVYEGRCMKSALKEAANVAYPGTRFPGKPEAIRKGLMRMLAETVFVEDQYIGLGVEVPSGTEQRIKHVMTPQGPRSAINVVDYVAKPRLSFTVSVLDDFLPPTAWARVWQCAEEIGIGADRARGDGRFELVAWDRA